MAAFGDAIIHDNTLTSACLLIFNPEPYTPYSVEISPVTQVVGQGGTTRQIVLTQEGEDIPL